MNPVQGPRKDKAGESSLFNESGHGETFSTNTGVLTEIFDR